MSTTKVVEIEYRVKVTGDKIPSAPPVPSPKRDPKNEKESLDYLKALEAAGRLTGGVFGEMSGAVADVSDGLEGMGISAGVAGAALAGTAAVAALVVGALYGTYEALRAAGDAAIESADKLKIAYDQEKLDSVERYNLSLQAQNEEWDRLNISIGAMLEGPLMELNNFWTGLADTFIIIIDSLDEIAAHPAIKVLAAAAAIVAAPTLLTMAAATGPSLYAINKVYNYNSDKGAAINDELALEMEYKDKLAAIEKDRIAHGKEEVANEKEIASVAKSRSADAAKASREAEAALKALEARNKSIANTIVSQFQKQQAINKENAVAAMEHETSMKIIALEVEKVTASKIRQLEIEQQIANLRAQDAIKAEEDPIKKQQMQDEYNATLGLQQAELKSATNEEAKTIADEIKKAREEHLKAVKNAIGYFVSTFTSIISLGSGVISAERDTKQVSKDYQDYMNGDYKKIMSDPNSTSEDKADAEEKRKEAKKAIEQAKRAENQASLSAGAGAISMGLTAAGIPIPAEALEIFMHPKKLQKMLESVLDGLLKAIPKILEVLPSILVDVGVQVLTKLPEILMSIFKGIWEGIKVWFDNIIDLLTFWKKDKDEPRNRMSKNRDRKTTIINPNGTVIRG